jgi:protocatechuate 3,4-dioxygenase beta subunit
MSDITNPQESGLTRRSLVTAGASAAALAATAWKLSGDSAAAATAGPAAISSGLASCVLMPELTEGPYYVEAAAARRNVREGRPGTPLELRLTLVAASTCKPIRRAAVEIWHCDAEGEYSGVDGARTRFLRGVQRTDAKGLALFQTLYPGWYSGRAVHIHLKAHLAGNVVHTGQLFFPESVTDAVYRRTPYSSRPGPDVRNRDDSIYRNGGSRSTLALRAAGTSYGGRITLAVQTA